ncbi:serine/threonine protein kinase [Arenimonas soli]|uniref:Serine/threonine protein kinase n=1 Tax=Arenimonas soli TaxID=2269504 RepID=A0ABQ1HPJ9_9GAMM|nr:tetratricopeptide repeat protein [Arenimonas soli]GGA83375.1 serine/threonine protein kinase [Arenimonas soli]
MSSDDLALWRAADQVLDQLLDLPAGEREAALQGMALAPALAERVGRLLEAHGRDDGPLDPAGPEASLDGRRIGCWQLDAEIGRGGMSVVYRAHTNEGGETRVAAIKLLTLGALVAGGANRFRREQAILARLEHPHIASLVDCGVAEDGTPWLAMPLVDGQPIDVWCDERGLGVGARVTLMLDVCDAVAYAHRNLVIHRDIKPSNVLVDKEGYVRLLDFGIGGLLESRQAGMTLTRMLAWTPQYAAPEQFRLAPASTAMDVYGLGALIYRLLTGRPPREGHPDNEPVTLPSRACLQDQGEHAPLRRLASRSLRGDLDAIVLKALAPDPDDRYRSPDALARDLKAWLGNRPVQARSAGAAYRLNCFLRRHRAGVVAGLLLTLALGSGIAATLWQAERARAEAARATAVKDFLVGLFESADPEVESGRSPDTRTVLARGAARVPTEFADQPLLAAELLHLIGRVQMHAGDYAQSREQLLAAKELGERHALAPGQRGATLLQLGVLAAETGQYAEARDWLEQARAMLHDSDLDTSRSALAYVHMYLGSVATSLSETDRALAELGQAEAILVTLDPDPRRQAHLLIYQGQALRAAGRTHEAHVHLQRALALIPEPGIADLPLLTALGSVASDLGQLEQAQRHYQQVVDTMRRVYPPGSPALATPLNNLSLSMSARGHMAEAEPVLREALALRRASVEGDSGRLAPVLSNYGTMLMWLGRPDEAIEALREALAVVEASMGETNPRSFLVLSFLCQAHALDDDAPALLACEAKVVERLGSFGEPAAWPAHAALTLRRLAMARLMLSQPQPAPALGLVAQSAAIDDREGLAADHKARAQGESIRLLALALQGESDPDGARALAAWLSADTLTGLDRADTLLALAAQAHRTGDTAAAKRYLAQLDGMYRDGDMPARIARLAARLHPDS